MARNLGYQFRMFTFEALSGMVVFNFDGMLAEMPGGINISFKLLCCQHLQVDNLQHICCCVFFNRKGAACK